MAGLRELKKNEKMERLLQESIYHFIEKGFDQTNIEDITRSAGVAKGTFYNFFDKKEDVLLYYLDREIVKSRHEIEHKIHDMSNIIDKLELLILTYMKNIFRNKEFAKVLVKERVWKIGTGRNWNEVVLMETIKQVLAEAREQNEIKKDIDLESTSEMIFGIYTMYTIYWLNGMIKTKRECIKKVKEVLRMFFDGVGIKKA